MIDKLDYSTIQDLPSYPRWVMAGYFCRTEHTRYIDMIADNASGAELAKQVFNYGLAIKGVEYWHAVLLDEQTIINMEEQPIINNGV